jgi:hypothetical protein
MLTVATLAAVFASPWAVPELPDPGEPHAFGICREDDPPAVATPSSVPEPTSGSSHRRTSEHSVAASPPRSNATALIVGGVTMLAAGAAMKISAPAYWEIDPHADPFSGAATLRAGYNTSTMSTRNVALGTIGTALQAAGVGLLRRGAAARRP